VENLNQFMMLICSAISIWAFAETKYKRLGFIAGLCGQPFWIYTTAVSGQWGMFLVSIWFTGNYIRGLWNYRGSVSRTSRVDNSDLNELLTEAINSTHPFPKGYCNRCKSYHPESQPCLMQR
jgi:hypothetical protein